MRNLYLEEMARAPRSDTMVKPLTYRQTHWNRWRISVSLSNRRKIRDLKGIHAGCQCVVLATGPSINKTDLSLIEDHPFVMGVNAVYRLRNHFRYYFCSDINFYIPNETEIRNVKADYFFFSSLIPFQPEPNRIFLKLNEKSAYLQRPMKKFQNNLLRTLSWGPTVVLDLVLPAAVWMGFKEIILVGTDYPLDHYERFYPEEEHRVLVKRKHFRKDMLLAHHGFRVFLKTLEQQKDVVRIYNCSPLTELDMLEKRDLAEMVNRKNDLIF